MKAWNPADYGAEIEGVLALDGAGSRLIPLTAGVCSSEAARSRIASGGAAEWFPRARQPEGALAGLYLYFSCFDQAHEIAQSIPTSDGSYWHAILHRLEPDAANSRYWFQRTGKHVVFPMLAAKAREIAAAHGQAPGAPDQAWDPDAFIRLCEKARRQPGSHLERMALEIQQAEWHLLFDHCARGDA